MFNITWKTVLCAFKLVNLNNMKNYILAWEYKKKHLHKSYIVLLTVSLNSMEYCKCPFTVATCALKLVNLNTMRNYVTPTKNLKSNHTRATLLLPTVNLFTLVTWSLKLVNLNTMRNYTLAQENVKKKLHGSYIIIANTELNYYCQL